MGEEAYKHHKYLQSQFMFPNMFGIAHGTYQIDNVFGTAAGINEMLLQSQEDYINLLPALSSKWKDGFVDGLRARGGYEVDLSWKNSALTSAKLKAGNSGLCKVKSPKEISKITSGNETIKMQKGADGVMAFETTAGKEYQLVFSK
jgi:alpha-L-fucosidase 2